MVLVLAPDAVARATELLAARGVGAWVLGHVEDAAGVPFRLTRRRQG
jgi:phosphoribosylaminoimidazole (AIR) synthetase